MKVQQGPSTNVTGSSPTPIDGVFSNLSPPSSGTATPKTLVDDDGFSLVECNPEPISEIDNCASPQHHDGIKEDIEPAQFVGGDSLYDDGDHGDPLPPYGRPDEDEEAELRALQFEMAYDGPPQLAPLKKGWTQHPPKSLVEKDKHYEICGGNDSDDESAQERERFQEHFQDRTGDYSRFIQNKFGQDELNLGEAEKRFQSQPRMGEPSSSSGNWGESIQEGEYRCALLPTRKAAWAHKPSNLRLSTLAAMALLKDQIIYVQDLEV